jgi:glycosyltransferase involved in cell wall biosynthesis
VLNQNYPNFEHIIVDGGSADGTIEILKKYPHLKWISEPDEGQSDALNKGFRMATGDWILWLNSDDLLLDGALNHYANAIILNKNNDVFYGHTKFIDEKGNYLKTVYHIPFKYAFILYQVYMPPSTGSLFRAELFKKNPLDRSFHYTMDTEWFLRVGENVKYYRINKVLSAFRVSDDNKTSQHIKFGKVLPQHAKEQNINYNRYILLKLNSSNGIKKYLYTTMRRLIIINVKILKLRYLFSILRSRFHLLLKKDCS